MNTNIFTAIGHGLTSLGSRAKTERPTYEDEYEFGRFRRPATPPVPSVPDDVVIDLRQPVYTENRKAKQRSVSV